MLSNQIQIVRFSKVTKY